MSKAESSLIKGAIFDCDGTLLDSLDAWRGLEGVLARQAGVQVKPEERKLFSTFTIPEVAHYFHVNYGLGASDGEVVGFIDEYMMAYYRSASLLPGASQLLESCAAAGVPMCVVSSSCAKYLEAGLSSSGVRGFFQAVVSVEDLGTTKREPTAFDHARELLGTERGCTWGFEDSLYAMDTLRNAGFPVLGLYSDANGVSKAEAEAHADIAVPSLEGITVREGRLSRR